MKTWDSFKKQTIRWILYSVATAVLVWLLVGAVVIYRDHVMGFHPAHIAWLAAKPDSWAITIHQALYMAGIWAVIALGLGLTLMVAFNLMSGLLILLSMAIARTGKKRSF